MYLVGATKVSQLTVLHADVEASGMYSAGQARFGRGKLTGPGGRRRGASTALSIDGEVMVEIKSLEQLREADERTQRFTPGGLSLGSKLTPESAAQFQQELVADLDLAPGVAAGTRQSFDRLRTIYAYGVLCYDIFTIVDGHALLVIEHALRDRFLEFHAGTVTFVRPSDQREFRVDATSYESIMDFLRTSAGRKALLRVGAGPATVRFNGMLDGLHRWARAAGLLRGQRNRGHERVSMQLRNFVAHPTSAHLLMPVDCLRTLRDLAEFINELWGRPTPGGRLYSAPSERSIVVVAWDSQGGTQTFLAEQLGGGTQEGDDRLRCVILRGRFHPGIYEVDPGLSHFDSRFENTLFPTDYLWGPGTLAEAADWYAKQQPRSDEVDHLDRVFAIRYAAGQLYRPMRTDIAAGLEQEDQAGTWHLVRADHPDDALGHVRNLITGGHGCASEGECPVCYVTGLATGPWRDLIDAGSIGPEARHQLSVDLHLSDVYARSKPVTRIEAGDHGS
ncbi:hypothetical protein COUCH_14365 [Couchioplanes caeruleus]|uniref:hypothetical protein n=1 Tax=Couchioplanes caeruleus TaxID=56438 RepID=UPI0020BDEA66|nr:hypothetical protein [Couchioplanes caeruleus]UQU67373.1 hypothetical protein COUCH_14365 [Couchioplanes caeruleus]